MAQFKGGHRDGYTNIEREAADYSSQSFRLVEAAFGHRPVEPEQQTSIKTFFDIGCGLLVYGLFVYGFMGLLNFGIVPHTLVAIVIAGVVLALTTDDGAEFVRFLLGSALIGLLIAGIVTHTLGAVVIGGVARSCSRR